MVNVAPIVDVEDVEGGWRNTSTTCASAGTQEPRNRTNEPQPGTAHRRRSVTPREGEADDEEDEEDEEVHAGDNDAPEDDEEESDFRRVDEKEDLSRWLAGPLLLRKDPGEAEIEGDAVRDDGMSTLFAFETSGSVNPISEVRASSEGAAEGPIVACSMADKVEEGSVIDEDEAEEEEEEEEDGNDSMDDVVDVTEDRGIIGRGT